MKTQYQARASGNFHDKRMSVSIVIMLALFLLTAPSVYAVDWGVCGDEFFRVRSGFYGKDDLASSLELLATSVVAEKRLFTAQATPFMNDTAFKIEAPSSAEALQEQDAGK